MIAAELLKHITLQFRQADILDARFEARVLTAHILGIDAACLSPISEISVTDQMQADAQQLVQQRIQGEPLQYLLGEWSFMGLPFFVSRGVLIPRADTEVLCEKAIDLIRKRGYRKILDLCCGTGCIGISLAKLCGVSVSLADISSTCLALAKKNVERNGVVAECIQTDLFSELSNRRFDLICCNPPYLTESDMDALQREVRHEPSLALYGGRDGLDFYRQIAASYRDFLSPNGAILLEIGNTQAEAVSSLFQTDVVWKDYAGNLRVVYAEA